MNIEKLKEEHADQTVKLTAEFKPWGKTHRMAEVLHMVVTEKIDGTNACVVIDGDEIRAGSRTRWITPQDDNYGFARWVEANREELMKLGRGRHYGEWWGQGIQRRYDLTEKRFSLFNTARPKITLPACVHQVPVLYEGPMTTEALEECKTRLLTQGSVAAPGFMKPEGFCIYIPATGHILKNPFNK